MPTQTYNLHSLGWSSFQQLCLTITREILGQTVESFLDSADGGRDGAFAGHWQATSQELLAGSFVVQCKFTSKSDYSLRMTDISDEVTKAKRLVAKGLCDSYLLMTNAGVSGCRAEEIKECFQLVGVKHVAIFGSTWINQQITENKRLRMLVPRVYGLGDLSQVLDERAYSQAQAILESLREDLSKVVVTDSYRKAAKAIDEHGFVLLIGEPAAGKTTIASLLAMAALDQWQSNILKLDEPGKVVEHWNPEEPSQFYWLDDAFGVTQYEHLLANSWNHVLPHIKTMLRRGAKFIMTSRDYIYNRARKDLKGSAFPLLNESQVVIDVHDLTINEKGQILYNHLKLGKQARSFISEIKPYLEDIASHPRFIPETARRIADPLFTKELFIDAYYLRRFVEKREQLLKEVLQGLDTDSKAALALIYMRNDRLESPVELQPSEVDALARLDSTLGKCITALEALNGSLVLHSNASGESTWKFKHPTIGDAYAEILVQSPEMLGIYIRGSSPERIVEQVTCGDVGIEKAVVVPKSLFPLMLTRLNEFSASKSYKSKWLSGWGAQQKLQGFLSRRCSVDFVSLYIVQHPDILDRVSEPGLYLNAVPEVFLAKRLHEFGLFPEDKRIKFVNTVVKYALDGDDVSALDDADIQSLFTNDELNNLREKVRTELLPRLDEIRRDFESSYNNDSPPDEYMQQLLESFGTLKKCYSDDENAVKLISLEIQNTNDWIAEKASDEPESTSQRLGTVEASDRPQGERSIFDDIDADNNSDFNQTEI